ncbi:hypothetical protein HDK64DRAFT_255093 [Phyllosticta capitalensis]
MPGIYCVETSPLSTNPFGSSFRRFWYHRPRYYRIECTFPVPCTPRLSTEYSGYYYRCRRYRRTSYRPARLVMCTFRQTSRYGYGDELVDRCNHRYAGPDCPRKTYEEYGRRPAPSGHVPSFLSGASTPTTELGPPTPTHEGPYATVTRSPGFGQEFLSTDRKPHHRRKHRRHGSTATQDSQPSVMVMDPPRGPPKGPPNRTAAPAADPGSESEGSRRRNRRPPPIDTSFLATNLPTVVSNYASATSPPEDNEYAQDTAAKDARDARHSAQDTFREEERRREREEKAKDEYYEKYEARRGDWRAEERARKARERAEKENLEREGPKEEPVESDDYATIMAERELARERAREAAREAAREEERQQPEVVDDQTSSTWSSAEYQDRIKKGQSNTAAEFKRSSSPPQSAGTAYRYKTSEVSPDDDHTPRASATASSRAEAYYEKLREWERRQTANERLDRTSPTRSHRHGPEPVRLMSMAERRQEAALLEAEVAVAEAEARVKKTKREIGRDNKGNLAYIRRSTRTTTTGGARDDAQKRRVRIFNPRP